MFDWDDLRFLLAIHREGSLVGAGKRLRVDPTTVGRRLSALEHALRAHLVARSSAGLALTAMGQRVVASAERAEQQFLDIERAATGTENEVPAGRVRMTMLQDVADSLLLPLLPELKRRHPLIRVDLWCTMQVLDLAVGEADLAIRVGRPTETDLVARRLTTLVERPHASRGWLDANGLAPEDVTDLDGREVLLLLLQDRWTDGLGAAKPALRASAMSTLIGAARADMGIVMVPDAMARAYPELVPLPNLPVTRERALWLVMVEGASRVPRIRAVADLVVERLGSTG
jgi:DNA-binding transcriptional LysR family regulator